MYWIGKKQFLFSSSYLLNAEFQNVGGLNGAEVRVGGIHEGTVKQIVLPQRPDGKVRVVMQLASRTRDVVRKDSVAVIRSEGLVGDRFVEISFGSNNAPKVNNGDTVHGEPPLQISDLVKKTDLILDSAKGTIDDLQSISSKIIQGTGTLGALVNDKKLYQRVNAGANAFQEDAEPLKHNFFLRGYFNKRGYESSADLKRHEISHLPIQPVAKKFSFDAKKIFEKPDTAKLKDANVLNEAGSYLESNQFGLVVIAAYTDMKGDREKDRVLTEARAMVVRDNLVQNFKLDDTRIKTIGLGKSAAEASVVEINVYPVGTTASQVRNQPGANQ